jgi:type III secretory pathway component EscU
MDYPEVTCFDVVLHAMLYLLGVSAVVCFITIGVLEYMI